MPSAPRGTCACIASPRRCTSVSASSRLIAPSACSAENSPTLWPAAISVAPDGALGLELGELRGGERDQRRLRELGAEQDAARVPGHAPVREPQLARVALDDVEQRRSRARARVCASARSHIGTRGARTRAALGAEALALDALAGEDERGRQRVDDRLAERDVGLPRAHADLDHAPAAGDGDARRLEVEDRAERDGSEERDPPLAQQRRVAAAQRVDDERRRAGRGPRAVGDRPRQPGHPRRQDGAMERVAIAADARERLHRGGRRVLGGGEGARGARVPLGAGGREQGERGATGLSRDAADATWAVRWATGPRAGETAAPARGERAADRRDRLAGALDRARRRPARLAAVRHVDRRLGADVQDVAGGELRA